MAIPTLDLLYNEISHDQLQLNRDHQQTQEIEFVEHEIKSNHEAESAI